MSTTDRYLAQGRRWPETWEERHREYERREDAYKRLAYRQSDLERLGLFQSRAPTGEVNHQTRRLMPDLAYVQNVDAQAMIRTMALNVSEDLAPDGDVAQMMLLEEGLEIWRRSRVRDWAETWARMFCVAGDMHFEVQIADGMITEPRPVIVAHRAYNVEVTYDPNGLELLQARVEFDYLDEPDEEGGQERHRYKRILDRETVRTWVDGVEEKVIRHGLGIVPWVHVQFESIGDPLFALSAGYGMEDITSFVDSVMTQVSVSGGRAADPWLKVIGASILGESVDGSVTGKVIEMPPDTDIAWLEASLQGLNALVEMAAVARDFASKTRPEFLFTESGANASGTALSYRAGQFEMQITPPRDRFLRALARATAICWHWQNGRPWSPGLSEVFTVEGGPVLPQDRSAIVDMIRSAMDGGLLTQADAIRQAQSVGVAPPDDDPEVYAEMVRNERAADDERVAGFLNGMRGVVEPEEEGEPTDEPEDGDE